MNRRRLFVALLWPTALVVLVGVLAFFQYRWLGQVSEADRDRQRIGRLTSDVMESCESLIRDAGCAVEVAVAPNLPMVNLDESAYRRALNNLVTNALKYAADGKWLAVTVFQAPDTQVVVAVADRGRGIDPKDVPHIFDAFYRGGYAKDRQIHGNGLGLSLVQRIVDAHGGSVSVHTSPAGSTFTMKFNQ